MVPLERVGHDDSLGRDLFVLAVRGESIAVTTWHGQESLAEVLRFVLAASLPEETYISECSATLALSMGSPEWATEIRAAFSNPGQFLAAGADEGWRQSEVERSG